MQLGKIVIAGGTGLIGQALVSYLADYSDDIVLLSRKKSINAERYRLVQWDGINAGPWQAELEACEVVINLSGKSIQCRFTEANKKLLRSSRLDSTSILRETIKTLSSPPRLWLNSSGTGIYPSTGELHSESSKDENQDFLGTLCRDWEMAFFCDELKDTRRVALRTAPVLTDAGGMLAPIKRAAKFGAGGKQGSGKQWFSWIHINDLLRAIHFIIHEARVKGPVNMTAPNPVRNEEFMAAVRKAVGIPFGIPTPAFLMKLMSPLIGIEPGLALDDNRVVSSLLEPAGFQFEYPEIDSALVDILGK